MTDSSQDNPLTPLQKDVLVAFFSSVRGFFLTGGAALAGFWLRHRATSDLDLFTLEDSAFERGPYALREVAARLGATLEVRVDAAGFKRFTLTRADEALVVDLVRERVMQLHPEKKAFDGILVDPPDEILANKLTALVGRQEERDLVDVLFLERRAALRVEDLLSTALAKDGGCTPATLAWLLDELRIPDGTPLPAGVTAAELREYVSDLVIRMRRIAHPGTKPTP